MQVNILDAKNRLSQLIKSAQAGEEVVIARRGEPAVRLVAAASAFGTPARDGSGRAFLDWLNANPPPAHRRRGHEEIEADIVAERAAWE